jgi:hypothetical protein
MVRQGTTMERRGSARPAVLMEAAFRQRGGMKFCTRLLDLTSRGARIETGMLLRERSDGWLHLPTLSHWHARIVWRSGSSYGLEFPKPFHEAVMTMLLARAGLCDGSADARPGNDNSNPDTPGGRRPSRRDQILAGIAVPPASSFVRDQFRSR